MTVTHFELHTEWRLDAPIDRVWELIATTEHWPGWWPAVIRVQRLEPGDAQGLGAIDRMHWRTALPYTLSFDIETVAIEKHRAIEGRAFGELDGTGLWTFEEAPGGVIARYLWRVEVTKPWMRLMAPLLAPVFAWNHHKVMRWGEAGAKKRLSAPLPLAGEGGARSA
jgi:hypothetical protein